MKATGIVRKVDELGRIVLPIELRRTLNIEIKDPLEIYVDGESIMLKISAGMRVLWKFRRHPSDQRQERMRQVRRRTESAVTMNGKESKRAISLLFFFAETLENMIRGNNRVRKRLYYQVLLPSCGKLKRSLPYL